MNYQTPLRRQFRVQRKFAVQFASIVVGAHGVFILATTLLDQIVIRHGPALDNFIIDIPLLIGLSLLYLSTLLRRRKRTAWTVTVVAYAFYLGLGAAGLIGHRDVRHITAILATRALILPVLILIMLFALQKEYVVRSDIQGFGWAARFAGGMILVALVYGVAGFSLLDKTDFHQEIGVATALHYTIDQFGLTTAKPLHAYTKRAQLFVDSLSFVSVGAGVYAVISLFQPLRLRRADQTANRQRMLDLLRNYKSSSEDYFKLWPHDKQYFFDDRQKSGLAFHVYRGVALCVGDPAGDRQQFTGLVDSFEDLCFGNDWLPAFIHVPDTHRSLYEKHDFSLQKIGQEAIVTIEHFQSEVAGNKYFPHIRNKFANQGFSCELLLPPHHPAVLERLQTISHDWLRDGGRVERGFVMGYYSTDYMQQCAVMVARDAAGTIQAFINQLPTDFDDSEANFDMLRHTKTSLGNINDFVMINFIAALAEQGYRTLNMGLCPLVGLDEAEEDSKGLIDGILRFAYANGDRFYSFSGLYRFKTKYEPEWRDRFIAYRAGLRGFTRTTNALMRTMRVKRG